MLRKIQGKKLSKKTNYKQNFKKFVESGYTNLDAFKKACKGDENLLIYTCLKPNELNTFIEGMKQYEDLDAQIKYLKRVDIQPAMHAASPAKAPPPRRRRRGARRLPSTSARDAKGRVRREESGSREASPRRRRAPPKSSRTAPAS